MHDFRNARRMVVLDVINNYVPDFCGVHQALDILNGDMGKIVFYRIEQRHHVVEDEIVVVGCPVWDDISMEIPDRPVDGANPVNIRFYFYRFHRASQSLKMNNIFYENYTPFYPP
jgi:hypothetical protein